MPTTFTPINPAVDTTGAKLTEISTGLWSPNETGSLLAIYSSSVQIGISGEYYYDMYNLPVSNTESEVQFSVAYGHVSGAGSPPLDLTTLSGNSVMPTQVIYSQYRNILLAETGSKFTFGSTSARVPSDHIYVININRARVKQYLDPGNWQLTLSGSNGVFTFIDDSGFGGTSGDEVIASVKYNIRSGSIQTGLFSGDTTYYGTVFPDYGTLVFNPSAIANTVGFVTGTLNARTNPVVGGRPFAPYTGSGITSYQYQHEGFVRSISASMAGGYGFFGRSIEEINSNNYFITLNQNDYNYTNNPSYYTVNDSNERVVAPAFRNKKLTYPTTIGLYNANEELLAVAKLSRPIQKSDDKRLTVRVRLDY